MKWKDKMKRILSVMLAIVMVMSVCLTSLAAELSTETERFSTSISGEVLLEMADGTIQTALDHKVLLYASENQDTVLDETVTDEAGAFSFTEVAAGSYTVIAEKTDDVMERAKADVTVADKAVTDVELKLVAKTESESTETASETDTEARPKEENSDKENVVQEEPNTEEEKEATLSLALASQEDIRVGDRFDVILNAADMAGQEITISIPREVVDFTSGEQAQKLSDETIEVCVPEGKDEFETILSFTALGMGEATIKAVPLDGEKQEVSFSVYMGITTLATVPDDSAFSDVFTQPTGTPKVISASGVYKFDAGWSDPIQVNTGVTAEIWLNGVNIVSAISPIKLVGNAKVTLGIVDGTTNTLECTTAMGIGVSAPAGINVPAGTTLTIVADTKETGKLNIISKAIGIGGNTGAHGANGVAGTNGVAGANGTFSYATVIYGANGGAGTSGTVGKPAGNGSAGQAAGTINIDGGNISVVGSIGGGTGGAGGTGGRGGSGGNGGYASYIAYNGSSSFYYYGEPVAGSGGSGGHGAAGGAGGAGAAGGAGGTVNISGGTLYVTGLIGGGAGGRGGYGGIGGTGGTGRDCDSHPHNGVGGFAVGGNGGNAGSGGAGGKGANGGAASLLTITGGKINAVYGFNVGAAGALGTGGTSGSPGTGGRGQAGGSYMGKPGTAGTAGANGTAGAAGAISRNVINNSNTLPGKTSYILHCANATQLSDGNNTRIFPLAVTVVDKNNNKISNAQVTVDVGGTLYTAYTGDGTMGIPEGMAYIWIPTQSGYSVRGYHPDYGSGREASNVAANYTFNGNNVTVMINKKMSLSASPSTLVFKDSSNSTPVNLNAKLEDVEIRDRLYWFRTSGNDSNSYATKNDFDTAYALANAADKGTDLDTLLEVGTGTRALSNFAMDVGENAVYWVMLAYKDDVSEPDFTYEIDNILVDNIFIAANGKYKGTYNATTIYEEDIPDLVDSSQNPLVGVALDLNSTTNVLNSTTDGATISPGVTAQFTLSPKNIGTAMTGVSPSSYTVTVDKVNLGTYEFVYTMDASAITVSFDANGGLPTSIPDQFYMPGETFGTLPTVTNTKGSFDGWYTAKVGGTKVAATDVVSSVFSSSTGTLYAHWTADLTVSKVVKGNQGDMSKEFTFKVKIMDGTNFLPSGTVVNVAYTGPNAPSTSSLVVGSVGTLTFTLKHGQGIVVKDLNTQYRVWVTEDSGSSTGYTTTYQIGSSTPVASNEVGFYALGESRSIEFVNTKNGTPPTGILLDIWPYILMIAIVLAGIVTTVIARRRGRSAAYCEHRAGGSNG